MRHDLVVRHTRQVKQEYDRRWIVDNVRRALREPVRHGCCTCRHSGWALELGADVVGGIPWIEHSDRDAQRHVDRACDLAVRTGGRVAMLVDDAGDPAVGHHRDAGGRLARPGLGGRGVASS